MRDKFELVSNYKPSGDQPEAINQLTQGLVKGDKYQTLLGVTGSGKTFTISNVIAEVNKPTLVISHNKTLAAQLYSEFKAFFPNNAVEFFISYYDYYQPEAYVVSSDLYIEKDFYYSLHFCVLLHQPFFIFPGKVITCGHCWANPTNWISTLL